MDKYKALSHCKLWGLYTAAYVSPIGEKAECLSQLHGQEVIPGKRLDLACASLFEDSVKICLHLPLGALLLPWARPHLFWKGPGGSASLD